MARETKVGLLAGLAFIICFAVILANRGANAPSGMASSILPNGTLDLPKLVQRNQQKTAETAARPNAPRTPAPVQPRPQIQPAPNEERIAIQQQPADPYNPAPGAQVPMGTNPKPAGLESQNSIALNTRQYDLPQASDEGLTRALTSRPGNEYPLQNPVPVSTPNGGQSANDPTPYPPNRYANTEPQVSSPGTLEQPSTPKGTTYTVKPSDTLSSIAAAHYGSKSAKSLETIFNANRNVLTDMDHLKSGVVLFIPEMAAPTETKSSAPAAQPADSLVDHRTKQADKPAATKQKSDKKPAEAHTAASSADSKNFRWYQVQKNDRFASIAREQLGDAGRWQEIHEMNKDKFPDPQRIREGVRIKLPLTAVAQAKEKKR